MVARSLLLAPRDRQRWLARPALSITRLDASRHVKIRIGANVTFQFRPGKTGRGSPKTETSSNNYATSRPINNNFPDLRRCVSEIRDL